MDQLDLLKKDWKKQEGSLPKYSIDELSKLMHRKSSSIVKWILIISILEITLPNLIYLFVDYDEKMQPYHEVGASPYIISFYVVVYAVVLYFIYRFYKNYRSISADSSTKGLIHNIIKTRRTVKHYIWFNLAMIPIAVGLVLYTSFQTQEFAASLPEGIGSGTLFIIGLIITVFMVGIFWLFYQLIYGILLKKLKKNYKELLSNGNELEEV